MITIPFKLPVLAAAAVLVGWSGGAAPRVMGEGGAAPAGASGAAEKKLTDEQIRGLIEKLGAEDFKTRTAAHQELVAAGSAALAALQKASQSSDAEVAEQARVAIRDIRRAMATAATANIAKNHLWCYDMEKGASWFTYGAWPMLSGDTAYVAGNDSKLHAVDIKTGQASWTADLAANAGGMAGMVAVMHASAGEKYVAVVQNPKMTVFGVKETRELWQKDLRSPPAAAPAGGGGVVAGGMTFLRAEAWVVGDLVVVRTDHLAAYKGPSGEEVWSMDYKPASKLVFTDALAEGVVYLCLKDAVAAVDVAGKKELWKKDMPGCMKLLASSGTLMCMGGDKFVALDANTGDKLWEAPVPAAAPDGANNGGGAIPPNMVALMAVLNKRLATDQKSFYAVSNDVFTSYDLKTGAKTEGTLDFGPDATADESDGASDSASTAPPPPLIVGGGAPMKPAAPKVILIKMVADNGKIYGVTTKGIYAFDGKSGTQLWMLPLARMVTSDLVIRDGVLYYAMGVTPQVGSKQNGPGPKPAAPQPAAKVALQDQPGLHAVKCPN